MSDTFKCINTLDIFEIDGSSTREFGGPTLEVSNHWNKRLFVNITIEGKTYTILAEELKRAIDNAQNAHRF